MNEQKPTVFQLNEFDWWAGYDLESVKSAFLYETGFDEGQLDNPHEVADLDMERLKFVDGDDPINADGTPGGTRSFREQLDLMIARGEQFPCFFASTEY
jgi:hypothetical protein